MTGASVISELRMSSLAGKEKKIGMLFFDNAMNFHISIRCLIREVTFVSHVYCVRSVKVRQMSVPDTMLTVAS